MHRRDFIKAIPAAAAVAVLPAVALATPSRMGSGGATRLAELNQWIMEELYPHQIEYNGHLYHALHQSGRKEWLILFTGFKPWQDSTMASGQWLAWPTLPSQKLGARYYYSDMTVTWEFLLGYSSEAPIPQAASYEPGQVFCQSCQFAPAMGLEPQLRSTYRLLMDIVGKEDV